MAIQRLSSTVVSSLRTDVTITTTAQCVIELVLNSIDAGATSIAVRVDLKNFKIQVIDNGRGLSFSDMNVVGSRYMTSKCHSLHDLRSNLCHFGFRGEALSSISEVCGTLTVVSRHQDSEETYCKVFTQGVPHIVGRSRQQRASSGTTITVADFLYNRPVRRARIKSALELEDIKTQIETIALINHEVSFSLRNDINNDIILKSQRSRDIPSAFETLFGSNSSKNLIFVKNSHKSVKVEGYISNEAHFLKNLQFIYVNRRLVLKTKLHKLVNSMMARSAILKSNNVPHVPISKEMNHMAFLAFSPPKRDKHAIFILNVTCPFSEYDITLDPRKTLIEFCNWDSVLFCFEDLLRKFIETETNHHGKKDSYFDSEPPKKRQTVVDEINQLAREEALGGNNLHSSQELTNTIDLRRAVHSLPARRDQVNISPDLVQECIPSTASSDLCSFGKRDSCDPSNSGVKSVFSETPYPPFQVEGANNLRKERHAFTTDTENSPVSNFSSKLKCSIGESKCLLKKTPDPPALVKKPVKGFISTTCLFEERFRKISDSSSVRRFNNCKDSVNSSPIDALENIKQIRKKKFLNNLKKFSYKEANSKPMLYKSPLRIGLCGKISDNRNLGQKLGAVPQVRCEEPPIENMKKSKGVQTFATPVNTRHDLDMISELATCQSSVRSLSVDIEDSSRKNTPSNLPASQKCGQDDFSGQFNDCGEAILPTAEGDFPCSKGFQNVSNEILEPVSRPVGGEPMDIISVEDLLVMGVDMSLSVEMSNKFPKSSRVNRTAGNICQKSDDELMRAPCTSASMDFKTNVEDQCTNEVIQSSCNYISTSTAETILPSGCAETPEEHNSTEVFGKVQHKSSLNSPPAPKCFDDTREKQKIVDYDSSPSSFQEVKFELESPIKKSLSSPNAIKRKTDEFSAEENSKKLCLVESTSPAQNCMMLNAPYRDSTTLTSQPKISLCEDNNLNVDKEVLYQSSGLCSKCNHHTPSVKVPEISSTNLLDGIDDGINRQDIPGIETLAEHHQTVSSAVLSSQSNNIIVGTNTSLSPQEPCAEENSINTDTLQWVEELDDFGKAFYVHTKSGMTTYNKPCEVGEGGVFKCNDRFAFLPKGMSPIFMDKITNEPSSSPSITYFKEGEDLLSVKWGTDEQTSSSSKLWPLIDQLLSEADKFSKNTCSETQVSDATMQGVSQNDIKVYNVVFPYSFTKDIFNNLRVLGQLDNKFIVTLALLQQEREVVLLFDQHAVHERIRVESLTHEYQQHDGTALWKSSPVEPALPLPLSSIEVRILESYQDKMETLGFHFTVIDSNTVSVRRVPTCLLLRENREVTGRGVSVLRQHLESLIREQVDCLLNTRGVGTDHPTIIRNVISSEACRGAVKFGHSLTVGDCQAFLHNLSSCNLPFQCAHGRPSLMPIVDLSMVKQQFSSTRPNLLKLKTLRKKSL